MTIVRHAGQPISVHTSAEEVSATNNRIWFLSPFFSDFCVIAVVNCGQRKNGRWESALHSLPGVAFGKAIPFADKALGR